MADLLSCQNENREVYHFSGNLVEYSVEGSAMLKIWCVNLKEKICGCHFLFGLMFTDEKLYLCNKTSGK